MRSRRTSAIGQRQSASTLDQDYLNLKERERINQLSLTMLRHRTLNSGLPTGSFGGSQVSLNRAASTNPFSQLPAVPMQTAFTPSFSATDFIPGLSGHNIYDPNLTADEIRHCKYS